MDNTLNISSKSFNSLDEIDNFITTLRDLNTGIISRSKDTYEWWQISAFAYYNCLKSIFSFPITITRCSLPKPDFFIEFSSAEIGIELTFCSCMKYEQAKAECDKRGDGSYPINTNFMLKKSNQFDEKDIHFPGERIHGQVIYGDFGKFYTIEQIIKSINSKIYKYKNTGSEFDLVVYINLPSNIYLTDMNRNEISSILPDKIDKPINFKTIHILWAKDMVHQLVF